MDNNINLRKNSNEATPIENIVRYIKENFTVKSERNYTSDDDVGMISFEHDDLIYIVDIYPKKPKQLRIYILFGEPPELNIINEANAISRYVKGSIVKLSKDSLCVEFEQMMYGIQSLLSAGQYIKLAIVRAMKYMETLVELESGNEDSEDK